MLLQRCVSKIASLLVAIALTVTTLPVAPVTIATASLTVYALSAPVAEAQSKKELRAKPVTDGVMVTLGTARVAENGNDLNFTITVEPNGNRPAMELLLTLPIKTSKASYIAAIRAAVKAFILDTEGVTLQNNDIIIWPLLE